MSKIDVRAFYKFVSLPGFAKLRDPLKSLCLANGIRGTILLAPEGINGTIAGQPAMLSATMTAIRSNPEFSDLADKLSSADTMPFLRMKVRLKKEIVTLGVEGIDPTKRVGRYVQPEDWNALITDPDVLVIDTRNSFEVKAGTFEGAIDPETNSFGEFPTYVQNRLGNARNRKIAMFCTGGIRCEKATSYLLREGFSEVYHLSGGILRYLERVPPEKSLWHGSCFVFDDRGGLSHGLQTASADED